MVQKKYQKFFEEKVVIITGASSGIGAELARQLAGSEAKLCLAARGIEKLKSLVQELSMAPDRLLVCQTDVQDANQIKELVQKAKAHFGQIDILINNAGVGQFSSFEAASLDEMHNLIATNYWGTLYACKEVLPIMRAQNHGSIVNITSIAAIHGQADLVLYSSSKAAVHSFTQGLRMELSASPIKVIDILPGVIDNEFHKNALGQQDHLYRKKVIRGASTVKLCGHILNAVARGKKEVIYPRYWGVFRLVSGALPALTAKVMTWAVMGQLHKKG